METFTPPLDAIRLTLSAVGLHEILDQPAFRHVSEDDVDLAVKEFGRFAAEVVAPTDRIGDREGALLDPATGEVRLPAAIGEAYRRYVETGWGALAAPLDDGGGHMPGVVGLVTQELFASANMALSLNPTLTQGSIELLSRWGTDAQRATYLPRLVTGEWSGTMNLTEPEAGSDLGAVRARAVPRTDGRWSVSGTKIFITWGEHDLADNIVHLVLARTPDAPAGTKGISLFVVPKFHSDESGAIGARNAVRCIGLEHKLGIHASPTCTIEFDEAVGELVGGEHQGMAAMFTMMNAARLSIGLQGLSVSERAYQQALAFARERVQGRAPGAAAGSTIIEHPDVARMLLTMASGIDAMRLILYSTAAATDLARAHTEPDRRAAAQARADLLTPIAKAWSTDEGVRLTSLAIQVHGGMGYVEETGIAQRYRDARIAPIYEGTNGIQAIDLVSRKVQRDGGQAMFALIDELEGSLPDLEAVAGLAPGVAHVAAALAALREATTWLVANRDAARDWLAGATAYLDLAAVAIAGALLGRVAALTASRGPSAQADAVAGRFCFFAVERASVAPALLHPVTAGADRLSIDHLA